jgi:BirA family biotin operon repressor/biotin-[acetyl-CoA-carboxylase] ligase
MAVSIESGLEKALLVLLADGRLHSGERLAPLLGVSRAALRQGVQRLRLRGIEIEAVARRGYHLPQSVELLDERAIRSAVSAERSPWLRSLDVRFDVDSTNTRLLALGAPPLGSADVILSELQHAGRGRRGRHWVAPFGGSIALSMSWSLTTGALANPALSLCVGVAVVRALQRAGARGIGLKWPNDIWFADRKLGGVLVEVRSEPGGPSQVVIGVGVNVNLSARMRSQIEGSGGVTPTPTPSPTPTPTPTPAPAAVADACSAPPSRNFIAGAIIDALLSMLADFERDGFRGFREAWTELDALRDRPAEVLSGDAVIRGIARGVDAHGALRLEHDGRVQKFVSGEVSLRGVEQI